MAQTITVTDVSGGVGAPGGCKLRDAITAANTDTATGGCPGGSGADTIVLPPNSTVTLSAIDNAQFGANGLPAITSQITIQGNGAVIQRDPSSAAKFRLFAVLSGGNLTLQKVTLKNGMALGGDGAGRGGGGAGMGGAIFNQGVLLVEFSTIQNNVAQGGDGGAGAGSGGGGGLNGVGGPNNGGGGGFFGAGGSGGAIGGAGGGGGGGTTEKGKDNNGAAGGAGGASNGGAGGAGGAGGSNNTTGSNDGGKGANGTAGGNGANAGGGGGGGGNGGNGGNGADDGGAGGNGGNGGTGNAAGGGGGGNGGAGGDGGNGSGNERGNGGNGANGGEGGFGGGGGGGGIGGLRGGGNESGKDGDGGDGGDGGFGGGGGAGGPGGPNGGVDGRDGSGNVFAANGFFGVGGGGAGMGGAIFSNGSTLTVRNSTITGNSAIGGAGGANVLAGSGGLGVGGGIFVRNGAATINNATLNDNDADFGGSLYTLGDGPGAGGKATLTLRNSILDGTPTGDPDCRVNEINNGSVDQSGNNNNLIDNNSSQGNACGGATKTVSAGLAPLAFNGGDTQTHAITTGSPAYNNGGNNCEATDQRGVSRPQAGACDIGAYEYSGAAPTVTINQASGQADPTSASPINFTVVFSESVTGFTGSDVSFAGSTVGGTLVANVTGGGANYNVAVSGMSGAGAVVASVPAGAAVNLANNGNAASTSADNKVAFDNVAPTVTINQAAGQADPTNASPINFTVVFSEPVTDFTGSDVSFAGSAVGGTLVANVTGNGPTYNVAVSGMSGSGKVAATITAGVAKDAAGNGNAASTSVDNTVLFDNVAPTVTINQAAGQADPTSGSPINFTVVFSKPVTGFALNAVTLSGTAGAALGLVSGNGTTYNVAVSGMTGDGTVIATVGAGKAIDAAGNGNAPSTSADNVVTFQLVKPGLSVTLADPAICTGPGGVVAVTAEVTNPGAPSKATSFAATLPPQLLALPGSCAADVGTCAVVNSSSVIWSGTLAAGQKARISYQTQIADDTPTGTRMCVNSTASFNGGSSSATQACAMANCPTVGPGTLSSSASELSDQKAGSVLIYNVYTSGVTSSNGQNTRINLTNTDPSRPAMVHLFFVDGATCSVADSYLCLTPSQTSSFLMSDIDPGTTGYLVAVAVDRQGCPIDFNYLIGDEYVKFSAGQAANLPAEAISALAGGLASCNGNSLTAQLNFNGVNYNRLPRALALDNIPSRSDGNDTMLILNRIGGHLGVGAATLTDVFGIFYDDMEVGVSFSFSPASCQFRSIISNNFPRITPRFEQFVASGHSGWLRLYSLSDQGILGAALNANRGVGTSAEAFQQGRNLHKLTLSSGASITIPLFPPNC
jgi:hypothetical protein